MELFFSSCLLYLDYFDSKWAHTVTHPRVSTLPWLPDGNGSSNRQEPLTGGWWRECTRGGRRSWEQNWRGKHRGGTQGLIKELFNSGELSFGAASHSYPALHFLASDPFSLNAYSAPSSPSSLSLSLQPLHILASLSSKSESLGLLSSNCIFL